MTKPTFTGKRTSWRLKRENLRATANQTSAIMRKQKDNVSYPYCNVIFWLDLRQIHWQRFWVSAALTGYITIIMWQSDNLIVSMLLWSTRLDTRESNHTDGETKRRCWEERRSTASQVRKSVRKIGLKVMEDAHCKEKERDSTSTVDPSVRSKLTLMSPHIMIISKEKHLLKWFFGEFLRCKMIPWQRARRQTTLNKKSCKKTCSPLHPSLWYLTRWQSSSRSPKISC